MKIWVQAHTANVPFGPGDDSLPAAFKAVALLEDRPLRLLIEATFDGDDRVHAASVTVERADHASVTPVDMTATRLGWVMNRVICQAMQPAPQLLGREPEQTGPLTPDQVKALARLYWIQYVAWGDPRQSVMNAFNLHRSTANYWIRKARDAHGLPGHHAPDRGNERDAG